LLFTDLHLSEDSAEVVFNEVLPGIAQAARLKGETTIACLGDLYHFRYRLSVDVQNRFRDWLLQGVAQGQKFILLPGNHDQYNLDGRNALEVFNLLPGVKVYTTPVWDEHGFWVPYRKRPEDLQAAFQKPRPSGSPNVLFLHHGVRGAMMNNHIQDEDGLPAEAFNGWEAVLCGHYHKRQTIGRVTYLGSPWQTKADEAGQEKGYALWDGKKLQLITTAWGPRHFSFRVEHGAQDLNLAGVTERDIVQVTTAPGVDVASVSKFLETQQLKAAVVPELERTEQRIQLPEAASFDAYIQAYVNLTVVEESRRAELLDVFKKMIANENP
jgi:DNA repair exonuclease SbcCD nuclease subunit